MAALTATLALTGCTVTRYVAVTDTLLKATARADTIIIRDSVATVTTTSGDTVFRTVWRTAWRERTAYRTDTVYKTVTATPTATIEATKSAGGWLETFKATAIRTAALIGAAAAALAIVYALFRN